MFDTSKIETKCRRLLSPTPTMPAKSPRQAKFPRHKCLRQAPLHIGTNAQKFKTSTKTSNDITNSKELLSFSLNDIELSTNLTLGLIHVLEYYVHLNGFTKAIIKEKIETQYIKLDIYIYFFQ